MKQADCEFSPNYTTLYPIRLNDEFWFELWSGDNLVRLIFVHGDDDDDDDDDDEEEEEVSRHLMPFIFWKICRSKDQTRFIELRRSRKKSQ
jgi:hypothetical protein